MRKLIRYCTSVVVILFVSIVCLSCAKPVEGETDKAVLIDSLLSRFSDYGKFSGSVLVAENGEIVFKKGFGQANIVQCL